MDARKATCFLLHAYEFTFSGDITGGYYLRIEPLYNMNEKSRKEESTANNYLIGKKSLGKNKLEPSKLEKSSGAFQFRYNPLTSQYLGEVIENSNYVTAFESRLDRSGISVQDNTILDASYISEASFLRERAIEDKKSHEDVESTQANFVNYGQNIKLYRLIKNNIIDYEKFMEDESVLYEDDEENESARSKGETRTASIEKKEEEENDDESYGNYS